MNASSEPGAPARVPTSYRWIENGHIVLWLIKDTCWALEFKPGGIFMIFPTIGVALYILWVSRRLRSEFFHNLAVCLWITANSAWMLGEFFDHDARPIAAGLFITGLLILAFYYIVYFRKDRLRDARQAIPGLPEEVQN